MALIWRNGDILYRPDRIQRLRSEFEKLIDSLKWRIGTKPYVEIGGFVSGVSGIAIRNIGGMESITFRSFHKAVRRIFIEVMTS